MDLTSTPALGYNSDMALKKINVRFFPGCQVQLMLEPGMIMQIKEDGAPEGRDFSGQVRWILSQMVDVPPLETEKLYNTLKENSDNMSGHIRNLVEDFLMGRLPEVALLKKIKKEFHRINPTGPRDFRNKISNPPYHYILYRFPGKDIKEILLKAGVEPEALKKWRIRK